MLYSKFEVDMQELASTTISAPAVMERASISRLAYLRSRPAEFQAYLVDIGLPAAMTQASDSQIRHAVVDRMLKAAKGRSLGLNGMSVREFAHEDYGR